MRVKCDGQRCAVGVENCDVIASGAERVFVVYGALTKLSVVAFRDEITGRLRAAVVDYPRAGLLISGALSPPPLSDRVMSMASPILRVIVFHLHLLFGLKLVVVDSECEIALLSMQLAALEF